MNITACINLYFLKLCLRSSDGNSVVDSWEPVAMNGPVTRLNKILYFFDQFSMWYICEIRVSGTQRGKVSK